MAASTCNVCNVHLSARRHSCPQLGLSQLQRIRDERRDGFRSGTQQKRLMPRQTPAASSITIALSLMRHRPNICVWALVPLLSRVQSAVQRSLLERLVNDELDDGVGHEHERRSRARPKSGGAFIPDFWGGSNGRDRKRMPSKHEAQRHKGEAMKQAVSRPAQTAASLKGIKPVRKRRANCSITAPNDHASRISYQ